MWSIENLTIEVWVTCQQFRKIMGQLVLVWFATGDNKALRWAHWRNVTCPVAFSRPQRPHHKQVSAVANEPVPTNRGIISLVQYC